MHDVLYFLVFIDKFFKCKIVCSYPLSYLLRNASNSVAQVTSLNASSTHFQELKQATWFVLRTYRSFQKSMSAKIPRGRRDFIFAGPWSINFVLSLFCCILMSMLWVSGRYQNVFYSFIEGIDFSRQIMFSKLDPLQNQPHQAGWQHAASLFLLLF